MEETLHFEIDPEELEIFLEDVNGHLRTLEAGILGLEQVRDAETLNATFRAAHTLKAVAAAVGHERMAALTHALESLFDAMREGHLTPSPGLADELLTTVDVLRALRDEVVDRRSRGVDIGDWLARVERWHPGAGADVPAAAADRPADKRALAPEQLARVAACCQEGLAVLDIEVAADMAAFAPEARLLQAAMGLGEGGEIISQRPTNEDLLEGRHSGFLRVVLGTPHEPGKVEDILGGIAELASFSVRPYAAAGPAPAPTAAERPAPLPAVSEPDKTVRTSVERLDALMDLVGELVTDRTRLIQLHESLRARYGREEPIGALQNTIAHLGQIVDQLQGEVMHARMLPIGQLFDKLPRLVRDVARAAGKQVNLVVAGESTELDRAVIEAIGDPLVHLLRNAVDHGIEPAAAREAAGKPPLGTVWLTAEHAEGQIVVTVQDDGQGIDPQEVRQAAIHRGLLGEDEAKRLADDEALPLIFQPGLSTAGNVTGTSGRGVGLDIVRTNINRIGGSVLVETAAGQGTTFRVTLPLTLAIMQAMMVALGDDIYAVPMSSIVESLYLDAVQVSTVKRRPAIRWRDEVLPLLALREFFPHPQRREQAAGRPAIVVVSWARMQVGLIVDRLIGKQEIVVKPFGPVIGNAPGLAGCTIMGDGRIALIVDVPGLIHTAVQAQKREVTR